MQHCAPHLCSIYLHSIHAYTHACRFPNVKYILLFRTSAEHESAVCNAMFHIHSLRPCSTLLKPLNRCVFVVYRLPVCIYLSTGVCSFSADCVYMYVCVVLQRPSQVCCMFVVDRLSVCVYVCLFSTCALFTLSSTHHAHTHVTTHSLPHRTNKNAAR